MLRSYDLYIYNYVVAVRDKFIPLNWCVFIGSWFQNCKIVKFSILNAESVRKCSRKII